MLILVAGFDEELSKICEAVLRAQHRVLILPQKVTVKQYLKDHSVDAVLLTMTPKDERAVQIYEELKKNKNFQNKPVMFLVSSFCEATEIKVLGLGAEDCLCMPFSSSLLLHRVAKLFQLTDFYTKKSYLNLHDEELSVIFAELVECRDLDTGGHLKNTTSYFRILLDAATSREEFNEVICKEDYHDVIRSAMLHDIGKIGILDEILRKETTLDMDEYEHMKTHTTLGKQTFDKIILETGGSKWLYLARDMAYCHHERWDGNGYPDGRVGEEIPFYARMLTIADVYDALTSNRTYKEAYSHEKATEIILEGRGSLYDPVMVDLFLQVNERFAELLLYSQTAGR